MSDEALPRLHGGGVLRAAIEVPDGPVEGVLFALGDRNGGFAAYAVAGTVSLTIASAGGEITVTAPDHLPSGAHELVWQLTPRPGGGVRIEHRLDGTPVASVDSSHVLPHAWQHGGTSITLGRDRGLPVTDRYRPPFPWTGTLHTVTVEAPRPAPVDEVDVRIALQVD